MIRMEEIANPAECAILNVFNPGRIEETKKEIEEFNQKTLAFLASVEKIKKDFNFKK